MMQPFLGEAVSGKGTVTGALRDVLLISYLYPPIQSPGTTRVVKFVKYLPSSGYRPIVLTSSISGVLSSDEDNLTYRAQDLLGLVKTRLRNRVQTSEGEPHHFRAGWTSNVSRRVADWQRAVAVPDPEVLWYPAAIAQALRVVHSHSIRIVYSTSPPETNHLVAATIKAITGLPWVADFRDGWMFEPLIRARQTSRLRGHVDMMLERMVAQHADRVVTVNEVLADDLRNRYPERSAMVSVITNGYDKDDITNLRLTAMSSRKLRVVYTGRLSSSEAGRSIQPLLQAVTELRASNEPMSRDLEIILVGALSTREREVIETSPVRDSFVLTGQLPYSAALQHQADADVVLLITTPGATSVSTTKLYEYLAFGKPILALAAGSAAARLISDLNAGLVVGPENVHGIKLALEHLHSLWTVGGLTGVPLSQVERFSRHVLTRELASIFDTLVNRRG